MLKNGTSRPISREAGANNHELTQAKLVSVPAFQQPAKRAQVRLMCHGAPSGLELVKRLNALRHSFRIR
jgi:hypothetical protein